MSIIHIKEHDESICNLKKRIEPVLIKPKLHTSKFRPQVTEEEKANKHKHRTFGLANEPVYNPSEFLKKHSKPARPQLANEGHQCLKAERRPPLPPLPPPLPKGGGVQPDEHSKNFRVKNVVQAIRGVPRQPKKCVVNTRGGDVILLDPSGLEPNYLHKKNYGKVPRYILQIRREEKKLDCLEKAEVEKRSSAAKYIPASERQELLDGLKHNWERLQTTFQGLPMMTDNVSKVRRKLELEAELKQIEHDIRMIERHPVIYVQPSSNA